MTPTGLKAALALAIAVTPAAVTAGAPRRTAPGPTTTRTVEKKRPVPHDLAVRAVRMIIKNAEFKDMPFEEFIEWLERTTKANIIVRWKLLEKAGIDRNQPISLKLKNVPLRRIIELVLDQLKRDDPSVRLAAKADGNTLILSTARDLYRELVTRTYDVQDLLLTLPQFSGGRLGPPMRGPVRIVNSNPSTGKEADATPDETTRRLIEMIKTSIQPESWKENGGEGTIRYFKGRLIVRNNQLVHEQLGGGSAPSLPSR